MIGTPGTTRILSARLEPDGTIRLQLIFPGSAEPVAVAIEPIETTIRAAGSTARSIDLAYGHQHDRHLRLVIAMHADALAYERERQAARARPIAGSEDGR